MREIVPVKRVKDVKTMITILSTLSQMLCTWRLVPKTDPNLRQENNLHLGKTAVSRAYGNQGSCTQGVWCPESEPHFVICSLN